MPYGPHSSEAKHPHQLFSARWFVHVQQVSSSLLVVLEQQRWHCGGLPQGPSEPGVQRTSDARTSPYRKLASTRWYSGLWNTRQHKQHEKLQYVAMPSWQMPNGWVETAVQYFIICRPKFTKFNVHMQLWLQFKMPFSVCCVPEIIVIKSWNRQNFDTLGLPIFLGRRPPN